MRFGHREAVFGVGDRGLEQILPRQLAEALVHLGPAVDRAGNGDAVNAVRRACVLMPCLARNSGERAWGAGPDAFKPGQLPGLASQ